MTMSKSKSSTSSFVVPSILFIHLMNLPQFLNATGVELLCPVVMILPLTKI